MSGSYASKTSVSQARSRAELEELLQRFGADSFGYMIERRPEGEVAIVAFRVAGRHVRKTVLLPSRDDKRYKTSHGGKRELTDAQAYKKWEQEGRRKWRSLVLLVKAKLVAIEEGDTTIEAEFLADIMMPDGYTIGETIGPRIAEAYETKKAIPLLPAPKERRKR
jgi:hypothetical protein